MSQTSAEPEVLESPPRRKIPRRVKWIAAVLAILLAVPIASWWLRARDLHLLVSRVESAEETIRVAVERRNAVLTNLIVADLRGLSPGDIETSQRRLVRVAAAAADDLEEAHFLVRRMSFLPWHGDIASVRDRYGERVADWRAYWSAGQRDLTLLRASEPQPGRIDPSLAELSRLLTDTLPPLPPFELAARVDALTDG